MTETEVVWRMPLRVQGEWTASPQLWVAPVCSTCRPWPAASRTPRPCSGCGRGVVADADDYWPWPGHVFCSDRCAAHWWDRERARGVDPAHVGMGSVTVLLHATCLACGRPIIGRRTTCGVACRQKLYRLRKRAATTAAAAVAQVASIASGGSSAA